VPVVDIEKSPAIDKEQSPVNGINNVWEYYFEQPQGRGIENIGSDAIITDGTTPSGLSAKNRSRSLSGVVEKVRHCQERNCKKLLRASAN